MRSYAILLVVVLFSQATCEEKKSVKKLQIGVKKRIENCTLKSKKGDVLHMHYTVREEIDDVYGTPDHFSIEGLS